MDRKQILNSVYWMLAIGLILWLQTVWQGAMQTEPVPYSEFEQALAEGRIQQVTVSDRVMTGRLKTPDGNKTTLVAVRVEPDLAARLDKFKVPYTRVVENTLLRDLMSWVVPSLIFVGLWYFVIRRLGAGQGMGSFMSIGKSRAKVYVVHDTGVTFADVAGVDEAKDELKEVVDFL